MLNAYIKLSTCRHIGMDIGPIPFTAIQDYSDRHELGDLFVYQIMAIDRELLSQRHEDRKKAHGK